MGRQITSDGKSLPFLARMRYFFIAMGLFFFAVGFFVLNMLEENKALTLRFENNGVMVQGVIKGTTTEFRGGGRGRTPGNSYWVGYTYNDTEGRQHQGRALHPFADFSKLVAGNAIQVIYLKDAPDTSRTVLFQVYAREKSIAAECFVPFLMGVIPLLLGLYQIYRCRRNGYKHR